MKHIFPWIARNPRRAAFLQNEYRIPCLAILMNCTLRPGDGERSKSSLRVSALYKNIHEKMLCLVQTRNLHQFVDKMFALHGSEGQNPALHKVLVPPWPCLWTERANKISRQVTYSERSWASVYSTPLCLFVFIYFLFSLCSLFLISTDLF